MGICGGGAGASIVYREYRFGLEGMRKGDYSFGEDLIVI